MQSLSVCVVLCIISFLSCKRLSNAANIKDLCFTCKNISDNFKRELERTAKKNFGGGNTAWEERKLSRYESSEIRLTEILENLCESSNFECNHMVEEHEEHFETWWFTRKAKHPNLFTWFCIETVRLCCPNGTFGPDCNACVGGDQRPCHGNGVCDGDGTRGGDGRCSCNHGYQGELCLECAPGYYSAEGNDSHVLCTECHTSCKTCSGPTSSDCHECKSGWQKDEQQACIDVDECASSPCEEEQFCMNTDGSYSCKGCDRACVGCKGAGPEHCVTCAEGYTQRGDTCTDVDECEQPASACPGEHRQCVNTKGSFRCFCPSGFREQEGVCVKEAGPEEVVEDRSSEDSQSQTEKLTQEHEDL